MKFRWGFGKLGGKASEVGMGGAVEAGHIRKSFMGEVAESARGAILLPLSMILLVLNLLNGERNSRP